MHSYSYIVPISKLYKMHKEHYGFWKLQDCMVKVHQFYNPYKFSVCLLFLVARFCESLKLKHWISKLCIFYKSGHKHICIQGSNNLAITNKAACAHTKHDNQCDNKVNALAFINFYLSKFSQPWFVKIFHQIFALYNSWKMEVPVLSKASN